MKSKRLLWGMVIGLIACLAACKKEQPQSPIPDSPASLQKLFNPAYQISTDSIHRMIRSYLDENKQVTPWDSALVAYYQEKDEFFWLNDSLVSDKPATQPADSLLYWLGNISKHGIHPGLYLTDSIRNDLEQIRTLQLQGKKTMNRLLADVEYGTCALAICIGEGKEIRGCQYGRLYAASCQRRNGFHFGNAYLCGKCEE